MVRLASFVLFLPACIGGVTTGAVRATSARGDEPVGVELRMFGAGNGFDDDPLMPNAYGLTYRQIGDEHVQTAAQLGWAGALRVGRGVVFGRLMFDVLSSQRTLDGDRKFAAFSPTLDLGVLPVRNGLCLSASATYDIHFGDPDRWLLGAFIGACGSDRVRGR